MIQIGKRIIELREKRNLSTNKLANIAGISQAYLRQVELGKTNPTIDMLSYIIAAMGISIFEFFDVDNCLNHNDIKFMEVFNKFNDNEKAFIINLMNLILNYKK